MYFGQISIDLLAENDVQVIRKNKKGQVDDTRQKIEMSGDPAKDAFRRGLIAGVLKGDERFISFKGDDDRIRTIAKVIKWEGNDIIFHVYGSDTDLLLLKRRSLLLWNIGDFWKSIKLSQAAKDYFVRNGAHQGNDIDRILGGGDTSLDISGDYHFLSRTSDEAKEGKLESFYLDVKPFAEVVDWTDPSLKRWMRRATDIIKEKTGITPGPQKLNAHQRFQIYHVWFNDIVPLIEDANKRQYGHFGNMVEFTSSRRDGSYDVYLPYLGHVLDIKGAVCKELSEFGIILFSEYGLRTKFMSINPRSEIGHAWIKVHGDGFVEFINSNGMAKMPHTDLYFLKEHYPSLTDEEISSLVREINLVAPPST